MSKYFTRFRFSMLVGIKTPRFLFFIFLLIIQTKLLWGWWKSVDLPLWDGSLYYHYGWSILNQHIFPALDWSPFYGLYYAAFIFVLHSAGSLVVYFFHRVATIFLVMTVEYFLFSELFSSFLAFFLALVCVLVRTGAENHFVVHYFVVVPLLLSFFFAASTRRNKPLILLFMFLAYLVRPEYSLVFVVILLVFLIDILRGTRVKVNGELYESGLIVIIGILFLFLITNQAFGSNRGFYAFAQHYAVGYLERNPTWGKDPWIQWKEPLQKMFGNVNSLFEIIRNNPGAFFEHITWNLWIFPREFLALLQTYILPNSLSWFVAVLLVFGLISGIIFIFREVKTSKVFTSDELLLPLICSSSVFTVMASVLLIRPRGFYMYALIPVLLVMAGLGLKTVFRNRSYVSWASSLIVSLITIGLLFALPMPYNFTQQRPIYHTVKVIENRLPSSFFGIIAASGSSYCTYLSEPEKCKEVVIDESIEEYKDVGEYLSAQKVQFIVLSPRLLTNITGRARDIFSDFVKEPGRFGWTKIEAFGEYQIFIKEN